MQKHKNPHEIKDVVAGILASLSGEKEKKVLFEEDINCIWKDAVGEKAFRYSHPTSFKKGRMVVVVSNSAWLHEITFRKIKIMKRIGSKLGEEIKEIRFKIGEI